jgi:hypothetical protein
VEAHRPGSPADTEAQEPEHLSQALGERMRFALADPPYLGHLRRAAQALAHPLSEEQNP